jgi:phosphate uptake regulator
VPEGRRVKKLKQITIKLVNNRYKNTATMTHLDTELKELKESIVDMWELVINQISKTHKAIADFDKDMAHEVAANEKRVDAFELKINMDCENILALFSPVANDLRLVLAVLKINYNLERIGDYANSIARLVSDSDKAFDKESLKETRINEMFMVGQECYPKLCILLLRKICNQLGWFSGPTMIWIK